MSIRLDITSIAKKAKQAAVSLSTVSTKAKNKTLRRMAGDLTKNADFIIAENKKDIKAAKQKGMSRALLGRLLITPRSIKAMSACIREVVRLEDPVGEVIRMWKRPNGLNISKIRVPIGVIGIIYESRPNVTSDCIGLSLKSGNSVILRGGKEAIHSNIAIYSVLNDSLRKGGELPEDSINLVKSTDRKAVEVMLKLDKFIDLVIPRGGKSLITEVSRKSRIPVIKHYQGICHTYVDEDADLNMAEKICFNAKVGRPGVCNAMETLLVHKDVAVRFLPSMAKKLKTSGVEIRGCEKTRRIITCARKGEGINKATIKDWSTEYLDLILSIKVVSDLDEAIGHIRRFGSQHSDAIVTDNFSNAMEFLHQVDSACVYVNASTRFTDGYQFGMGAEIGISTDKLHARGPMALEELTSYKYIVLGNGQIRR